MAENESNVQNGVSSADDTKTRKTVRLRPSGTPLPKVPAEGISDPLSARDTDTSNLEILDDTQTRRTVKIKPLAPPAPGTVKLPLDAENTNTRRTVVLRPQAAGADGENTNTRRTVVLRPQAASAPAPAPAPATAAPAVDVSDETVAVAKPKPDAPAVPVPVNPAPAAEVSDETVAVAKPKPAVVPGVDVSAAGEEDDRTVKVKRPVAPPRIGPRPMGAPLPKGGIGARPGMPGLKPAAPAAAPAAPAPAADDESSKETVKLPQPVRPAPAAAPKPAPAPAATPKPAPAPAAAPKPADAEKKNDSADDEITIAPSEKAKKEKVEAANEPAGKDAGKNSRRPVPGKAEPAGNTASPLYLVLGLITLILMLGVTAFTLTQYLDFEQKIQIYEHVPGLPHAK
ncbi:MAG: hypothetical protein IKA32_03990 [Lentisphaeria bacterium]|nr:hypothetical protein [Lentisphaeria bacterium]